ncbi:MAG: hypothetical protein FWC82_03450 [Firmicutes bacterium]|nr:hypothetical protein [Bacillota bacterium]
MGFFSKLFRRKEKVPKKQKLNDGLLDEAEVVSVCIPATCDFSSREKATVDLDLSGVFAGPDVLKKTAFGANKEEEYLVLSDIDTVEITIPE